MRGNFITDRKGCKNPNYKDGRKNSRLYSIYNNMITRCYNSKSQFYYLYGGRNIIVCDEWKNDFQAFYEWAMSNDYADDLSIDRIDVNGNYEPNNCRWVTQKSQCRNKRNNHYVVIDGVKKSLVEWCETYNINYQTVQDRLKRGWNIEKALKSPVQTKFRKKVV